jgi:hypothetical protein
MDTEHVYLYCFKDARNWKPLISSGLKRYTNAKRPTVSSPSVQPIRTRRPQSSSSSRSRWRSVLPTGHGLGGFGRFCDTRSHSVLLTIFKVLRFASLLMGAQFRTFFMLKHNHASSHWLRVSSGRLSQSSG